MYDYDGLPGDGKCWYGRLRTKCRSDQVYMAKCDTKEKRQQFRFVHLDNEQVQIKLGDGNLCFERQSSQIFLEKCDSDNKYQTWFAPNGSFDGRRFEVSQKSRSGSCMTQDHHPKPGEVVELHSCSAARSKDHQTSYWNKY